MPDSIYSKAHQPGPLPNTDFSFDMHNNPNEKPEQRTRLIASTGTTTKAPRIKSQRFYRFSFHVRAGQRSDSLREPGALALRRLGPAEHTVRPQNGSAQVRAGRESVPAEEGL